MHFSPPVSRDRIISTFPKCYNPQACLQMKDDWDTKAKMACQDRAARLQGYDRLKMSKAVVVGDLNVGKTCLINRFCKDVFERDYKATIGVDFEIERFEMSGLPYSLQIWDTAGQEKFKCIASAYYRGAQVIITVFDMADIKTLENTQQWLSEALKENEPNSCFVFLVGTKRDLLETPKTKPRQKGHNRSSLKIPCCLYVKSAEECERTERDAIKIAAEMNAEFWSVSSKTGENVQEFFFRVAALAFEDAILKDLETEISTAQIGDGSILNDKALEDTQEKPKKKSCC
ncbi:ras-related protein Rab-36 isoform X2 [Ctenopharyngodon idella]|uniref:ras-related protein Rab-36 isoform X2 n=1 Tax=Ctenopharyngodon idella TaxID=7959 RepID=UPI00222F0EA1|nr:ras-related protein Rab-36 isoform X2 [Ctenopharyngodon idella]